MSDFQTLNSGEWSEVYVFLKLLSEPKLDLVNADLESSGTAPLRVMNIESHQIRSLMPILYTNTGQTVSIQINQQKFADIPAIKFTEMANLLLTNIKTKSQRTYAVPAVREFLGQIGNPIVKSNNQSKRDITIGLRRLSDNMIYPYGFSIKSNLKSNSTLLNASKETNFLYEIRSELPTNKNLKTKSLLKELDIKGFICLGPCCDVCLKNLNLLDLNLSKILGYLILYYYQKRGSTMIELLNQLQETNPLGFADIKLYQSGLMKLLVAVLTNMCLGTPKSGQQPANGGMIVVKNDGSLGTMFLDDAKSRKQLGLYLLQNTYLDTASTTRHCFGRLYRDNGKVYLRLNLQIRFKH